MHPRLHRFLTFGPLALCFTTIVSASLSQVVPGPKIQKGRETSVSSQELGTPPVREQLFEWYVERAKALGKTIVTIPYLVMNVVDNNSGVDEELKNYDLLRGTLLGKHVQRDGDVLTTWYRFALDETISRHTSNTETPWTNKLAGDQRAAAPGEFFVLEYGGELLLHGVTLKQEPAIAPPEVGKSYLLFANIGPNQIAAVSGGWGGMFRVDGERIIPRNASPDSGNALKLEIQSRFGSSLSQLVQHAHQRP